MLHLKRNYLVESRAKVKVRKKKDFFSTIGKKPRAHSGLAFVSFEAAWPVIIELNGIKYV